MIEATEMKEVSVGGMDHLEEAFDKFDDIMLDDEPVKKEEDIKKIIWHLERYCEDVIAKLKYGESGEM